MPDKYATFVSAFSELGDKPVKEKQPFSKLFLVDKTQILLWKPVSLSLGVQPARED